MNRFSFITHSVADFSSGEVHFESQPTDYTTVIGASAYFNCTYSGYYGLPLWYINGTFFYLSLPKFHYLTKFGVMVTDVNKKSNQTTYECIVLNKRSTVGKLIILGKTFHEKKSWLANYYHQTYYTKV